MTVLDSSSEKVLPTGDQYCQYDLIVIGGGPAGLFAAGTAAEQGMRVCLLEKNEKPGKKLLLSGSGQCNLTHAGDIREFPDRYGAGKRFVRPCLFHLTNGDLMDFFKRQGVDSGDRGDGKVFPYSGRSRDVLRALETYCRRAGVRIICKSVSFTVEKKEGFAVKTRKTFYRSPQLLLATGGLSYPDTGSTGDGYAMAEGLGHRIIPPYPVLAPVHIQSYGLKTLAGLSFSCRILLLKAGRKAGEFQGDLLLTHKGFSGPVILNNSREMAPGDELRISFFPEKERSSFESELLEETGQNGKKTAKRFLVSTGLPERFSRAVLQLCDIRDETILSQLKKEARRSLMEVLFSYPVRIQDKGGFNKAMATGGGVSRDEVNPKTMGSKLVEGLYFAGEILDVDGDTGGYNLQFAFSSGKTAADHILQLWQEGSRTDQTTV